MKLLFSFIFAAILGLAAAQTPKLSLRVATYVDQKCEKHLKDVEVTYRQSEVKWGGGPCETIPLEYGLGQFKSFRILTKKNPHPHYFVDDTTTVNAFSGFYGQECDPSTYISSQKFTEDERGTCTESTWTQTYQNNTDVYGAGSLRLNSYAPGD